MKNIKISKEEIDFIFIEETNQHTVWNRLYKLVFPDWDNIVRIEGHPEVNVKTSKIIWELFIVFDRLNHPNVLPGALWMNSGWSYNDNIPEWEVSLSNCKIHYKKELCVQKKKV